MVGQHGMKGEHAAHPTLRRLKSVLGRSEYARELAASVQRPRIGCGLLGQVGTIELITGRFCEQDMPVVVYDFHAGMARYEFMTAEALMVAISNRPTPMPVSCMQIGLKSMGS